MNTRLVMHKNALDCSHQPPINYIMCGVLHGLATNVDSRVTCLECLEMMVAKDNSGAYTYMSQAQREKMRG